METNPVRAGRARTTPSGEPPADPTPKGPSRVRGWVGARVAGGRWVWRAGVLLVLAWILKGTLAEATHTSIFTGITLGFHEMGHAFFSWFGSRIFTTAGGTIFQILVPLGAAVYLAVKQRDPFGATVCLFWLGTSLVEAGVYASDARAQVLPLVSPFGPIAVDSHDWTVMLMRVGKLSKDQQIGAFLIGSGRLVMVAALGAGAWVLRVMATTPVGRATVQPMGGAERTHDGPPGTSPRGP